MKYIYILLSLFIFSGCSTKISFSDIKKGPVKFSNPIYIAGENELEFLIKEKLDNFYFLSNKEYIFSNINSAKTFIDASYSTNSIVERYFYKEEGEKFCKKKKCKRIFKIRECFKEKIFLNGKISINSLDGLLFVKNYNKNIENDSCKNNFYNYSNMLKDISDDFLRDIKPYIDYTYVSVIEDIDIKTEDKNIALFQDSVELIDEKQFTLALNNFEKIEYLNSFAIYYNMGLIYEKLEEYSKALNYYYKANNLKNGSKYGLELYERIQRVKKYLK